MTQFYCPQIAPISEFPGYFVSRYGEVFSQWKNNGSKPSTIDKTKWKQLKPTPSGSGYFQVVLCRDESQITCCVHHLVADAFLGYQKGMHVNHKDLNKENNFVENLEVVTRQANHAHAVAHGVFEGVNAGRKNGKSKLMEHHVVEIRWFRDNRRDISTRQIAKIYDISQTQVSDIGRRKFWQSLPEQPPSEEFIAKWSKNFSPQSS